MSDLREKIAKRLDVLESLMQSRDYEAAAVLIPDISKFWPVLSEEDRDFIHGCQFAIEENLEWK